MNRIASRPADAALDPIALRRLSRAVDDDRFVRKFAARYRELLPGRVTRISASLQGHDVDLVLDAVLSLKVSSATVGAQELAELAGVIEGEVRIFDLPSARTAAASLPPAALRADAALAAYLIL
jgi:HPt (histidine-containing phosphotransfer) domain-containing protein